MGRFRTREQVVERKKKILTVVVGIFFIFLMMMSALYYGLDDTEKVVYNDLKFVNTGQGWVTYNGDDKIIIWTSPEELETYNVDISSFESLTKIYLSVNPEEDVRYALIDLYNNFEFQSVSVACYEDNELCSDMPLKTCEDATPYIGVIVLKEAVETKVYLDGNCLTIEGQDLLKIVDGVVVENEGRQ